MGEPAAYRPVSRPYERRYRYLYRRHLFEKLRSMDLVLAEFQQMLGSGEVIAEASEGSSEIKEIVLLLQWHVPLHVVIAVDEARKEERLVTVYEPDRRHWTADLRRRR